MGIFDSLRGHPDGDASRPAPAAPGGSPDAGDGRAGLERRRDELLAQVAELHWDLGGLAYEMAIRDHFRLDVLVRRAAELQERDAELGELERVLSLREHVETGTCTDCGAVHGRGALYCWQCGKVLMERVPSAAANGGSPSEPVGGRPVGALAGGGSVGESAGGGSGGELAGGRPGGELAGGGSERASAGGEERAEEQTLVLPPSAPVS